MISALRPAGMLRRYWKQTAIAIFSLSIALALGVVALSVSNTLLLLPPAAPSADRLVTMYSSAPGKAIDQVSYADYQYYRTNNHVFTDVAAAPNSIGLSVDTNFEGRDVRVITRPVSYNYLAVMGIKPFLGKFFSPGDDRTKEHLAVMTWACWKRLGSDPKIVGKVLTKQTIIGVTPKEFTGAFYGVNGDLLTTLAEWDSDPSWTTRRDARHFILIARMKPGITRRQADAEITTLSAQLRSAYPVEEKDRTVVVTRATLLPPDAIPGAELMTAILLALVILVLLIACANVANLLLAIAVGRRQEAAIKLALGASRGRLIREFLKESTMLCAASGVIGYCIATTVVAQYSDVTIAFPMLGAFSFGLNLRLDATVVAFTVFLILLASLAAGLTPALYASSPALAQILGGETVVGGTRKNIRRNALVVTQIAVCTLVLVGMGLCQSSLYNLRHTDLGFSARNLLAVTIYLESEGYSEAKGKEFHETLRRTVSTLPWIESVSLAQELPLSGGAEVPVQSPDNSKPLAVGHTAVDSGYFATFGIRITQGRAFTSVDRAGGPNVVIINQKMADMLWPGQDPLGRTVTAGDPAHKFTIVGVAANSKYADIDEPARPFMYYALSQHYQGAVSLIARTKSDPGIWIEPLAQALRGLGLKIMIQPVTFQSWMNLMLLAERITAGCVAALSGLALLLAVIGLFGAISCSVSERKKELGIRVALGARPWQLLKMVLTQTSLIAGIGVAIGTLLGVGATVIFRSQLHGIGVVEWAVLIPVGVTMLALSLAVAYFSARPWVAIDPLEAVRHA